MKFSWRRKSKPDAEQSGPKPLPLPTPPKRAWTFMVYLAGDNNLEDYGREDLLEMKQVGSSPDVAIVAQFDRMQQGPARRYYLTQGGTLEADEVGTLGEINTGDPRELTRFMVWAMQTYPAERYALILWNHGTGWKEDDIYQVASVAGLKAARQEVSVGEIVQRLAARTRRPPLFASTLSAILARGIAYDDTACDFLDNAEMKQAIQSALTFSGVDKLALLGFDACLMNMIEVAYQIKDLVQFVVGSEETEPATGWPYDSLLAALMHRPHMETEEFAGLIVQVYMDSYGPTENITQSALNLAPIRDIVAALNELCAHIMQNQDACELAVGRASRRAQSYADPDYKDLYDFCRLLYERSDTAALQSRAQAIMELIAPASQGRFVAAEGHRGYRVTRSHGVSIYFPTHALSPFYGRLDFASESLWDDMLRHLFSA